MQQLQSTAKYSDILAFIVSFVSSPFVMFSLFLLIEVSKKTLFTTEFILFIIVLFALFIPSYLLFLIGNNSNILKLRSISRKNRDSLFLSLTVGSLINVFLFAQSNGYSYFIRTAMVFVVLWGLLYIINKLIDKISVHTTVFSFATIALSNTNPIFVVLILFIPLICWSRIQMHKHTWFQLLFGCLVGGIAGVLFWGV